MHWRLASVSSFKVNLPSFSSIGMDPDPKLQYHLYPDPPYLKRSRVQHNLRADPQKAKKTHEKGIGIKVRDMHIPGRHTGID
jgi:hypothetical protein